MSSVSDYYMTKLGITGELAVLRAARPAPFSNEYVSRELKSMTERKLIHTYRSADGIKVYRLSDPAGYIEIGKLSPSLLKHTEMVVGENGRRYPGNSNIRAKKVRDAAVVAMMADIGMPVDGINLQTGSIINECTSLNGVISKMEPEGTFYLSGSLLRKSEDGDYHTRRELTTSAGILVSPGGIYQTYAPISEQVRFKPVIDTDITMQIRRLCEEWHVRQEDGDQRMRAILYPHRTKIAVKLQESQKKQSFLNPTSTYKMCYVVPKDQNALDVTKMLTFEDWFSKIFSIIREGMGIKVHDYYDGITRDGKPIYNLLCNNIGKIEELRYQIENKKAVFLVHDWQKDVIEEAYNTKLDAITINETQFKGLLSYVEEMTREER